MKETSEHYEDPEDLCERDLEIARADSLSEIFEEAADELVAIEAGRI